MIDVETQDWLREEAWQNELPKICWGCDCAEIDWTFDGDVIWGCNDIEHGYPCHRTSLKETRE